MSRRLSRRRFVAVSTISSAALIAAPFVRGAHAAGKLAIGFWDHFVPSANPVCDALIREWAEKEKVEVQIDRFTGQKLQLTLAAEANARSGHDIIYMNTWSPHDY